MQPLNIDKFLQNLIKGFLCEVSNLSQGRSYHDKIFKFMGRLQHPNARASYMPSKTIININFHINGIWRVTLLEEICFPSAISFFSEYFQLKYFQNLLELKYNFTRLVFNSWTDTHQISAVANSDLENWKSGSTFWKI